MWKCIRCNKENQDSAEKCINCGHGKTMDYTGHRSVSRLCLEITDNWKKKKEKPTIMSDCIDANDEQYTVLGSTFIRSEIKEIYFVKIDLQNIPTGAWDVSEDKSKTIWAWLNRRSEGIILNIGSENGFCANPNSHSFFAQYSNVRKINFNWMFDTSQVVDMSKMFYGCSRMETLDVSTFNTSQVVYMSWMFFCCNNLERLNISRFDTSQVVDMSGMFYSCKNLNQLDVSKFDTSQVEDMASMFNGCENLKELDVSRFDTSQVKSVSYMFCGCENLMNVDISNFYFKVRCRDRRYV